MNLLNHHQMIFPTNVFLKTVQADHFMKTGTGKNLQVEKLLEENGLYYSKLEIVFIVIIVHFSVKLVKPVGLKKVIVTFKILT